MSFLIWIILKKVSNGTATTQSTYVGVNVKDPTHEAKKNSDLLDKLTDKETQQLAGQTTGVPGPNLTANSRYDVEGMLNGFVGGTLFTVFSYPLSLCLAQFS